MTPPHTKSAKNASKRRKKNNIKRGARKRAAQSETDETSAKLELVPQLKDEILRALKTLAQVAEGDDDALKGLIDIATEATAVVQRLWLQGHPDTLTSLDLYYEEAPNTREVYARDEIQERLRHIAGTRLVWPAILTTRPIDAEKAHAWLTRELQLGDRALIKPPRKDASDHAEAFRVLAAEVVGGAVQLCHNMSAAERAGEGEAALHRDGRVSGQRRALGRKLLRLSDKPSKKWLGALTENCDLLLGSDWLNARPKLRLFRHAYREDGGIRVPTHQEKPAPLASTRKLVANSYARRLKRHAEFELRRALAGILPKA